jgi:hypothetical protein
MPVLLTQFPGNLSVIYEPMVAATGNGQLLAANMVVFAIRVKWGVK